MPAAPASARTRWAWVSGIAQAARFRHGTGMTGGPWRNRAPCRWRGFPFSQVGQILLDLAFLVFDMFAHNRVKFVGPSSSGVIVRASSCDIGNAQPGRRVQTDLDRRRLRHLACSCCGARRLCEPPGILSGSCLLAKKGPESTGNHRIFPDPPPENPPDALKPALYGRIRRGGKSADRKTRGWPVSRICYPGLPPSDDHSSGPHC